MPAVGSVVHAPPTQSELWFTQRLEPAFSNVRVSIASGKQSIGRCARGRDRCHAASGVAAAARARPYRVTWRVLSVDTHVTEGDFTFDVAP